MRQLCAGVHFVLPADICHAVLRSSAIVLPPRRHHPTRVTTLSLSRRGRDYGLDKRRSSQGNVLLNYLASQSQVDCSGYSFLPQATRAAPRDHLCS